MASGYTVIESDDRGDQGLEFKSFLPNDRATGDIRAGAGASHVDRGYLMDQPKGDSGFWTVEYYQKYFDVDTNVVIQRCYATLIPSPSYFSTAIAPSPDLYGPFWTLTTLIFSLFVFSSLASSISSYLSSKPITYDFQLLSIAVTLVYAYGLGVPFLLWAALKYLGVQEWSLVEALAVWGYGQFVWIPVSVLCVIPIPILRWALVGGAFGLSGYFLVTNIYPVLAMAEAKTTRLLIIVIVILHSAIALSFKVLFFGYYVVNEIGPNDPVASPPDLPVDAGAGGMSMWKW